MRPIALASIGVELLQEAVLSVLKDASGGGMSTSDIARALGLPHSSDWHYHLVKQLLFHMERQQLVEDVRPGTGGHQWVTHELS